MAAQCFQHKDGNRKVKRGGKGNKVGSERSKRKVYISYMRSMSTVNEMGHLEDDHLPGVGGCLLHPGAFAAHQGLEGVQHAAVLELHGKASACPGVGQRSDPFDS
eukprot:scaffold154142_cov28-Prasinocladus_malaysianus.AAC.1